MNEESVAIPCDDFSLEGRLCRPPDATAGVVVCHPHPRFGGDMSSHVVTSICQAAAKAGLATLRFNFRGTGRSGGTHSGGREEPNDVLAAAAYLTETAGLPVGRVALVGYSFGSLMALAAGLPDDRFRVLVAVSPPLARSPEILQQAPAKPLLIVAGAHDEFVDVADLEAWAGRYPERVQVQIVPDEDHFWWLQAGEVGTTVARFLQEKLT